MALHSRKFLLAEDPETENKYASSSSCYMCYVCPDYCYLPPPPPPPSQSQSNASQKHQMSTILIMMLCVLGAAFLLLSYLTIRRYKNCRRRNNSSTSLENGNHFLDENHGPSLVDHHVWYIRTVGLPQPVIDSIAVFRYKKDQGLIDGSDCSVCLSEFQEDESLRLLPKCSHAFHVPCIDTWLSSHKNCPVCRAPIVSNNAVNSGPVEEDGSSESRETIELRVESSSRMEDGEDLSTRMREFRVCSDLGDQRMRIDQEMQVVRRSVSMDFSCAAMVCDEINSKKDEGTSDTKLDKQNSDKRSIYRMIKSSSFSGKRSLRKNSTSQESIPLPELTVQNPISS